MTEKASRGREFWIHPVAHCAKPYGRFTAFDENVYGDGIHVVEASRLEEMTALKDKAADIAIALGFEHNQNVKRTLCYHNNLPLFFGLGGGRITGPNVETVEKYLPHALIQFSPDLHERTLKAIGEL